MMNKHNNKSPLFLTLALLLIFITACRDNDRDLEEVQKRYDSISNVLEEEKQVSDSLEKLMDKGEMAEDYPLFFGKSFEGIENPAEHVANRLRQKPEAIPLEPVLGGNMEFRKIKVLTEDWVLALYDDGHIQGRSIYEYTIQPNGEVDFEVIASQRK